MMAVLVGGCSTAGSQVDGVDAGTIGTGPDARPDAAAPDALTARTIKVLTINLKTALPSDSTAAQRTQLVADLIAAQQPDVIALQEITESGSLSNRGEALAQATGYAWKWKRTHQLGIGNEGIGVMTRGTIAWHGDDDLPHTELGLLHRAVIGARVIVDGHPIELFSTHLTVAGSTGDRADQVATALAFARANHTAGVPAFLAGDLNATSDELSIRVLSGLASHDGVTGDLVDAWTVAEGTDPGFTIPSDSPDRRIDYIFAFPGSGTAQDCTRVLTEPVAGVRASDHLGVMCRFVVD